MVPPDVPLVDLRFYDLELWGMNGRPTAPCGRALAIIRHVPTDFYTLVSPKQEHGKWETKQALLDVMRQGKVSCFEQAIPFEESGIFQNLNRNWHEYLVGWVGDLHPLPRDRGLPRPVGVQRDVRSRDYGDLRHDEWRGLQILFRPQHDLEKLMNQWGAVAIREFDSLLASLSPNWSDPWTWLTKLGDFGLCATSVPALRYSLYVRYCAAMYYSPDGRPEGVHDVFKLFVRREFPTVDWDRFREDMRVVMFRGKDVAAYRNGVTDHTQSPLVEATTEGQTPPAG